MTGSFSDLAFAESYGEMDPIKRAFVRAIEPLVRNAGYTIVGKAGDGGFAFAYVVRTPEGQLRVLKIALPSDVMDKQLAREQALDHERRIMAVLHAKDPRFLKCEPVEFFETGKTFHALEMDFIADKPASTQPAPTLHDVFGDLHANYTAEDRAAIRSRLRELLKVAHGEGIYHLDLQPKNILVSRDPDGRAQVRLIDWGVSHSKLLGPSPQEKRGAIFGTLGYMSALRMLDGHIDPVMEDIYALRILEYYLRAGRKDEEDLVYRSLGGSRPSKTPTASPLDVTASVNDAVASLHDSEGFGMGYYQPGVAYESGSPREQMEAVAEWSRAPRSLALREMLLESARNDTQKIFLAKLGENLRGHRIELVADEILSSQMLSSTWTTALGFSRSEIEQVREFVMQWKASHRTDIATPYSAHSQMYFTLFEKAYAALPH